MMIHLLRRIRNVGIAWGSVHPLHPTSSDQSSSFATDSESSSDEMGKSNKFDYSNRANSGSKMGHIIGHALEKEADKIHKDAEKQAAKSRKASTNSEGSVNGKDPFIHVLDIKAPGKQLGDEGTSALAAGLLAALRKGDDMASLVLEDLNLSDNCITTKSLIQLAPIIHLAKHDLKTINLANNSIKVETAEEAQQWELFLRSFRNCFKMRRLDLSGNALFGAKALEIFFRLHLREDPINPLAADGDYSVHTLAGTISDDEDNRATQSQVIHGEDIVDDPLSHAKLIKRRCGLRSIPYVILQGIDLTDGGALWLSHILEDHHYPDQLIDELNAIQHDPAIKTYQQNSRTKGIEWDERVPAMGKDGLNLLERTEMFRLRLLADDQSLLIESTESLNTSDSIANRDTTTATTYKRRVSVRSIRTNDGGEHEASERESIRKKIQRSIIAQHGAASVDLWRAALKVVVVYRILVFSRPASRKHYSGPPKFNIKPGIGARSANENAPSKTPTKTNNGSSTYASTLLVQDPDFVPGEPELVITEVTNTPRTPKMLFKPHRKGGFSEGSDDLGLVAAKLEGLVISRDNDAQLFVQWQESHRAILSIDGFRDVGIPSHLPKEIIERIADHVLSEVERESLTAHQRERAYVWARDRGSIEAEKNWRKMADSAQTWTLLESTGCLNYEK